MMNKFGALHDSRGDEYYTDEMLLEGFKDRMEPGFSLPHHEGFKPEEYILKIARQIEKNAFHMGVTSTQEMIKLALGIEGDLPGTRDWPCRKGWVRFE